MYAQALDIAHREMRMGWSLIFTSTVLFFLQAFGSDAVPAAGAWAFLCLALGLKIGDREINKPA